jgi:Arc/MetJ-type ribon-helix-helix transcriptional regulator
MPRPRISMHNKKDHKVTVRLDDDTYQSLKEAIEAGLITNLSEALRNMIRQKLWEVEFSREIGKDLSIKEVSEEELREVVDRVVGDFDTAKNKEFLKLDGFLEGMFSALGGIVRKAMVELEKRSARDKTRWE